MFFKTDEVVVVKFFCDPLHIIITQAVYPFVGKPERTKIHSADTQHFILLTPIEGIPLRCSFRFAVEKHDCNKVIKVRKNKLCNESFLVLYQCGDYCKQAV